MTFRRKPFPFRGQHAVLDLGHFELEFAVGRVFLGVRLAGKYIDIAFVMEPGAGLAGKQKSPAYSHRPDGVKFIGIIEYFGLQSLRNPCSRDTCAFQYNGQFH